MRRRRFLSTGVYSSMKAYSALLTARGWEKKISQKRQIIIQKRDILPKMPYKTMKKSQWFLPPPHVLKSEYPPMFLRLCRPGWSTGRDCRGDLARLCSHWFSNYITALSLVESFIVSFHSVATPALLCNKEPAQGRLWRRLVSSSSQP